VRSLVQYDRIDPAEVQSLKDEIEQLKNQIVGAESGKEEQEKAFQEQQKHVSNSPSRHITLLILY
jgi:hypothetical protein